MQNKNTHFEKTNPWLNHRMCFMSPGNAPSTGGNWQEVTKKADATGSIEAKLKAEKGGDNVDFAQKIRTEVGNAQRDIVTIPVADEFKNIARRSIIREIQEFVNDLTKIDRTGAAFDVGTERRSLRETALANWRTAKEDLLRDMNTIEQEVKATESLSHVERKHLTNENEQARQERIRQQEFNNIDRRNEPKKHTATIVHLNPANNANRNLQLKEGGFTEGLEDAHNDAYYICTRDVINSALLTYDAFFSRGANAVNTVTTDLRHTSSGNETYAYTIHRDREKTALAVYPQIVQIAMMNVDIASIDEKINHINGSNLSDAEKAAQKKPLEDQKQMLEAQRTVLFLQARNTREASSQQWCSSSEKEVREKGREDELKGAQDSLLDVQINQLKAQQQELEKKPEAGRTESEKAQFNYVNIQIIALTLQKNAATQNDRDNADTLIRGQIARLNQQNPPGYDRLKPILIGATPHTAKDLGFSAEQLRTHKIQKLSEFAQRELQRSQLQTPEEKAKFDRINAALDNGLSCGQDGTITFNEKAIEDAGGFNDQPANIQDLSNNFGHLQNIQSKIGNAQQHMGFLTANVSTEIENAKKAMEESGWLDKAGSWLGGIVGGSGLTEKQKECKRKVDVLQAKLKNMAGSAKKLQEASKYILEKARRLKQQQGGLAEQRKDDADRLRLGRARMLEERTQARTELETRTREAGKKRIEGEQEISTRQTEAANQTNEAEERLRETQNKVREQRRTQVGEIRAKIKTGAETNIRTRIEEMLQKKAREQGQELTQEQLTQGVNTQMQKPEFRKRINGALEKMGDGFNKNADQIIAGIDMALADLAERKEEQEEMFRAAEKGILDTYIAETEALFSAKENIEGTFGNQLEALERVEAQTRLEAVQIEGMGIGIQNFVSEMSIQARQISLDTRSQIAGTLEQEVKGPSAISDLIIGGLGLDKAWKTFTRLPGVDWVGGIVSSALKVTGGAISDWMGMIPVGDIFTLGNSSMSLADFWERGVQSVGNTGRPGVGVLAGVLSGIRKLGSMVTDIIKDPTALVTGLIHIAEHPLNFVNEVLQINTMLEGMGLELDKESTFSRITGIHTNKELNNLVGKEGARGWAGLGEGAFNVLAFATMGGAKPVANMKAAFSVAKMGGSSMLVAGIKAAATGIAVMLKPVLTMPLHALKGVFALGKSLPALPEILIRAPIKAINAFRRWRGIDAPVTSIRPSNTYIGKGITKIEGWARQGTSYLGKQINAVLPRVPVLGRLYRGGRGIIKGVNEFFSEMTPAKVRQLRRQAKQRIEIRDKIKEMKDKKPAEISGEIKKISEKYSKKYNSEMRLKDIEIKNLENRLKNEPLGKKDIKNIQKDIQRLTKEKTRLVEENGALKSEAGRVNDLCKEVDGKMNPQFETAIKQYNKYPDIKTFEKMEFKYEMGVIKNEFFKAQRSNKPPREALKIAQERLKKSDFRLSKTTLTEINKLIENNSPVTGTQWSTAVKGESLGGWTRFKTSVSRPFVSTRNFFKNLRERMREAKGLRQERKIARQALRKNLKTHKADLKSTRRKLAEQRRAQRKKGKTSEAYGEIQRNIENLEKKQKSLEQQIETHREGIKKVKNREAKTYQEAISETKPSTLEAGRPIRSRGKKSTTDEWVEVETALETKQAQRSKLRQQYVEDYKRANELSKKESLTGEEIYEFGQIKTRMAEYKNLQREIVQLKRKVKPLRESINAEGQPRAVPKKPPTETTMEATKTQEIAQEIPAETKKLIDEYNASEAVVNKTTSKLYQKETLQKLQTKRVKLEGEIGSLETQLRAIETTLRDGPSKIDAVRTTLEQINNIRNQATGFNNVLGKKVQIELPKIIKQRLGGQRLTPQAIMQEAIRLLDEINTPGAKRLAQNLTKDMKRFIRGTKWKTGSKGRGGFIDTLETTKGELGKVKENLPTETTAQKTTLETQISSKKGLVELIKNMEGRTQTRIATSNTAQARLAELRTQIEQSSIKNRIQNEYAQQAKKIIEGKKNLSANELVSEIDGIQGKLRGRAANQMTGIKNNLRIRNKGYQEAMQNLENPSGNPTIENRIKERAQLESELQTRGINQARINQINGRIGQLNGEIQYFLQQQRQRISAFEAELASARFIVQKTKITLGERSVISLAEDLFPETRNVNLARPFRAMMEFLREHPQNRLARGLEWTLDNVIKISTRIINSPELTMLLAGAGLSIGQLESFGFVRTNIGGGREALLTPDEAREFDTLEGLIENTSERLNFLNVARDIGEGKSSTVTTALMGRVETEVQKPKGWIEKFMEILRALAKGNLNSLWSIWKDKTPAATERFADDVGKVATTNNRMLRENDVLSTPGGSVLLSFMSQRGEERDRFARSRVTHIMANHFRGLSIAEKTTTDKTNSTIMVNGEEWTIFSVSGELEPFVVPGTPSSLPTSKDAISVMGLMQMLRLKHAHVMPEKFHRETSSSGDLLAFTVGGNYTEISTRAFGADFQKENLISSGNNISALRVYISGRQADLPLRMADGQLYAILNNRREPIAGVCHMSNIRLTSGSVPANERQAGELVYLLETSTAEDASKNAVTEKLTQLESSLGVAGWAAMAALVQQSTMQSKPAITGDTTNITTTPDWWSNAAIGVKKWIIDNRTNTELQTLMRELQTRIRTQAIERNPATPTAGGGGTAR